MTDPHALIAAAVISQALEDAGPGSRADRQDVATSRAFLFSDSRGWAAARRFWFAAAGLLEPSRATLRRAVENETRSLNAAATRLEAALGRRDRGATTRGASEAA